MSYKCSLIGKFAGCLAVLCAGVALTISASGQDAAATHSFAPPSGNAVTLAGGGKNVAADYTGPAKGAALKSPARIALDSAGNLYFTEAEGRLVRVVASGIGAIPALPSVSAPVAGNIYTLAGSKVAEDNCVPSNIHSCVATSVALGRPNGLAVDVQGNVYISDSYNNDITVVYAAGKLPGNVVRETTAGNLYLLAGSVAETAGDSAESPDPVINGVPAAQARFKRPSGMSVDSENNLFITDTGNNLIRVLYAGGTVTGVPRNAIVDHVYTVAGSAESSCSEEANRAASCGDGGSALSAVLSSPDSVTVDRHGNLFISDSGDMRVRVVCASGNVAGLKKASPGNIYTIAGNGRNGTATNPIDATASALSAFVADVAIDSIGNIYFADSSANAVRKIDVSSGTLSTLFTRNEFITPRGVAIDASGNLYVADTGRGCIRSETITQALQEAAASAKASATQPDESPGLPDDERNASGPAGFAASPALLKKLGVKVRSQFTSDSNAPEENVTTIAGGTNGSGLPPGSALSTSVPSPQSVVVDASGNVFFSAGSVSNSAAYVLALYTGGTIPPVLAAEGLTSQTAKSGYVYYAAGSNLCFSGTCSEGGPAVSTAINGTGVLNTPTGIALDGSGNLYIADSGENAIRMVSATNGHITTIAGTLFNAGYSANGTTATAALLSLPYYMAVDASGDLYFTDDGNNVVQVIYKTGNQAGKIYTVAGNNGLGAGYNGDGIAATAAQLSGPGGLAFDSSGNLYIADYGNDLIRKVSATNQQISSVAGTVTPGAPPAAGNACASATPFPACGDDGPATSALLAGPNDVKLDASGDLYIADASDYTVREVSEATGDIQDYAGQEQMQGYVDGAATTTALFGVPSAIALDAAGDVYVADSTNNDIREVVALQSQTINFTTIATQTYGSSPFTLTATASSSLPITYALVSGPGTLNGATVTITGAGSIVVTASQAGNSTYAAASATQTIIVNPAALEVTANNVSVPVGQTVSAANFPLPLCTITGLVSPDTTTGSCAVATTADGTKPSLGATFPIVPTLGTLAISPGSSAANYATPFTYVTGTLTITGDETQTLTFPALPATVFPYGTAPIPLTATASSGLPVSYSSTGSATVTGSAGTAYKLTITGVGAGTVTATQSGNNQYAAATPGTQTFTVKPIVIDVAANNFTEPFGGTPAVFPYTITPTSLVNGDQLIGTPSFTTPETPTSAEGTTYPVTPTVGTLAIAPASDTNFYSFNFIPGTITVGGGTQSITFPTPTLVQGPSVPPDSTQLYYGESITLNAMSSAGLPITYTVSGPPILSTLTQTTGVLTSGSSFTSTGPLQLVGTGTVTITATQPGISPYAAAPPVTQTIIVYPYPLTVNATGVFTIAEGATIPIWGFSIGNQAGDNTIGGFQFQDSDNATTVQGAPVFTTTATPLSPPGIYPINGSVGTLTSPDGDYSFTFPPGQLTITSPSSFILTANPSTLSVQTGHTAQTTLIASAIAGEAYYQGTVALSCSGLPVGVTCTFSPSVLTLTTAGAGANTQAQATLTINTNPSTPVVALISPVGGHPSVHAAVFLIPGSFLGALVAFNRRRLRKNIPMYSGLILLMVSSILIGLAACGGSNSSSSGTAAPGTATVMVVATSTGTVGTGSPNITTSVPLTINITK